MEEASFVYKLTENQSFFGTDNTLFLIQRQNNHMGMQAERVEAKHQQFSNYK